MLLSRYNNIDFILSLDLPQFIQMVIQARKKNEEDRAFKMWLTLYPQMTQETFISFEDYFKQIKQPVDKRSAEQIVKSVEDMVKGIEWSATPS